MDLEMPDNGAESSVGRQRRHQRTDTPARRWVARNCHDNCGLISTINAERQGFIVETPTQSNTAIAGARQAMTALQKNMTTSVATSAWRQQDKGSVY
jgi:hypothetical protein